MKTRDLFITNLIRVPLKKTFPGLLGPPSDTLTLIYTRILQMIGNINQSLVLKNQNQSDNGGDRIGVAREARRVVY